jgi:16S rRNA (uracil1498-N3)-methyltransferase
MYKFFVPKDSLIDNEVLIEGDDYKHISKVLRLKIGEKIGINNCIGREYMGEIASIDKKYVHVNILNEISINNESTLKIYLFQGLPKSSKMDLIVQKATELGAFEITPIITQRVVVKNELNEFKKLSRWNRIILESCKQCKRSIIPEVNAPIEFEKLLERLADMDLIVVPYEEENGFGIKNVMDQIVLRKIQKVAVIIGPEGGFEPFEIEKLRAKGAYIVTLGPRIFRTETAGFVCISLLQYELGDLGGVQI